MFLVANPDVPSIRNAQRLLDRVRQLGACGERVRVLLNRAAEPYPIPPKQIEAALGHPIHHTFPSDYKTVSTALNSGVPLALDGQLGHRRAVRSLHARAILDPGAPQAPVAAAAKRSLLGLEQHRVHLVTMPCPPSRCRSHSRRVRPARSAPVRARSISS